jgi:hypothetical protein
MMDALGTSSCSNSSRFPSNMPAKTVTPVTFPPGRSMLSTRPYLIGSSPLAKTIGIVEVGGERP